MIELWEDDNHQEVLCLISNEVRLQIPLPLWPHTCTQSCIGQLMPVVTDRPIANNISDPHITFISIVNRHKNKVVFH